MVNAKRSITNARRAMTLARVRAGLSGRSTLPALDLDRDANGAIDALVMLMRDVTPSSTLLWWLRDELRARGDLQRLLDGLSAASDAKRIRSAQLVGALRIEDGVPRLGRMLGHHNGLVQSAAARALGLIGGARSADALVRALYWRRGATMRLVLELAKAAPDHYVESAAMNPDFADVRMHLALALGLRGRKSAVPVLLLMLPDGVRSERVACSRALGWIGDPSALLALLSALDDPAWQVRFAALKALTRIADPSAEDRIEPLTLDRYRDVATAADYALRRIRKLHAAQPGRAPVAGGAGVTAP